MTRLRAIWRLGLALLHGVYGLLVVSLHFPVRDAADRQRFVAWWSERLIRVMGIRLEAQGQFAPGAKLVVANHISWLDIMAIHAVCPQARFVSKAELQSWPLANRMASGAGTLFIEREKRRDALRVVHQMAQALKAGDTVAVFPEGTTADGHELLPFHANLLQAAIATGTPVQPVAVRFSDAHDVVSRAAQYVGDTTMGQSLWKLACGQAVVVHLQVLPTHATVGAERRALAQALRSSLSACLRQDAGQEPLARPDPAAVAIGGVEQCASETGV